MPKHALIIGGTGMLKGVTKSIIKEFDFVSVVSRSENGFKELEAECGKLSGKLHWLSVDYKDYQELTNVLLKAIKEFGEISLCVSWIHSNAPAASLITAKILNHSSIKCGLYEILGSADADPGKENISREESFKIFENLRYHKIILGFIKEKRASRWLTNEEICSGILNAIENDLNSSVIGDTEPWEQKS